MRLSLRRRALRLPAGPNATLSSVGEFPAPAGDGQNLWAVSIALFCIGQLLGSLNFIATTLDLRTKGMTLARMPLSTWAWFITACIGLLAFADPASGVHLLILDRTAGTSFFNPAGMVVSDTLCPIPEARRFCGSTCSGSSGILRFTSRSSPVSELFRTFCRPSHASRSSAECA